MYETDKCIPQSWHVILTLSTRVTYDYYTGRLMLFMLYMIGTDTVHKKVINTKSPISESCFHTRSIK